MHNPFMYKLLLLYKYRSSCCSVPIPILVKITILVADIIADPIIGTPLILSASVMLIVFRLLMAFITAFKTLQSFAWPKW